MAYSTCRDNASPFPLPETGSCIFALSPKARMTPNELIKNHGLQNKVQYPQINPTHLTDLLSATSYDENLRSAIAAGRRKP
jgi:hypothetical protein